MYKRLTAALGMIYHHTKEIGMGKSKIAITLDAGMVARLDGLVGRGTFVNRSQALEQALREKLERLDGTRLAREAAKLDPAEERALAEEGIQGDISEWPVF
jgi:Arc/MetJ-type ribon-helix-helix transcriptional regulator